MSESNKIRHIVRIQQMLKRWRRKARLTASSSSSSSSRGGSSSSSSYSSPSDVPAGHVAVCVGESCKRYIVRATYLNHPIFKNLLLQAEEEYGFKNIGPLTIPCNESVFEEILHVVSSSSSSSSSRSGSVRFYSNIDEVQRRCHVDLIRNNLEFLGESRPLLHG